MFAMIVIGMKEDDSMMVRWLAWELGQVMLAWLRGEGNLPGLLAAWWDVVSGRVLVGDEM